jgi:hypothetical protein
MNEAAAQTRAPVTGRGAACRGWYAVLAAVITASLPAWALAGWLLLGPSPRFDWARLGWAFLWPLLWIGYTFAHGAATGWYPYPFLDAHLHGYAIAVRNTAAVLVLALIIVAILRFLDRRLPTITR